MRMSESIGLYYMGFLTQMHLLGTGTGQELLEVTLPGKRWRHSSSSAPEGGSPRRLRQKGELAPLS